MKKIAIILMVLICVIVSRATTVTVCASGCDTTTVEGGFQELSDNDTLYIYDGIYTETVKFEDSSLDGIVVMGESESGTIIRYNVTGETYALFLQGSKDAGSESTIEFRDLTMRLVQDDDNAFIRFAEKSYYEFYNFTFMDSTTGAGAPTRSIRLQGGEMTFTNTTWSDATGTGSDIVVYVPVARNEDFLIDSSSFTDIDLKFTSEASSVVRRPKLKNSNFIRTFVNVDAIEDSIRVYNCNFWVDDQAAAVIALDIADIDTTTNQAAMYVESCTFNAPESLSVGSHASTAIHRHSDDLALADTIINCTTNWCDNGFYMFDDDSADCTETGGANSYIANNTLNHISNVGIKISYNSSLLRGNRVLESIGSSMHGFLLGPDNDNAHGVDKAHWLRVDSCYVADAGYFAIDKGNANVVVQDTAYNCGNGVLIKGGDTTYVSSLWLDECTNGVVFEFGNYVNASTDSSDAATMSTIKNIYYDECGAGLYLRRDSCLVDPQQIDHSGYIGCTNVWNNAGTVGTLTTLRAWSPDSSAAGEDCTISAAIHSTESLNWQYYWGGDSTYVITPIYNWFTMGIAQHTRFPHYPTDFKRLEHADSLITTCGQNWKYDDIINVSVRDPEQWSYLFKRYMAWSDSLYLNKEYKTNPSSELHLP